MFNLNNKLCINVLIFCFIIVIIFFLHVCNKTFNIENMADTSSDKNNSEKSLHEKVKKIYNIDVSSLRYLSELCNQLYDGTNLTIPGNVGVDGEFSQIPIGMIIAWSGKTIPYGWALCDGKDGRPNLSNRFILGSGSGNKLTKRDLGKTGGQENVKLNLNQIPKHRHSIDNFNNTYQDASIGSTMFNVGSCWSCGKTTIYKVDKTVTGVTKTTSNLGSNKAHNNMSPYYVLAWIIKTKNEFLSTNGSSISSGNCDETIKGKKGDGYRGCQNVTKSGKKCQKWTSQTPHNHDNTPDKKPNKGLGDHNYCRNPNGSSDGIWCYTTDPDKRWEYCDPIKSK